MGTKIIDGRKIAEEIRENLKKRVEVLKKNGVVPKLDIVLVGENPASEVYVRMKLKACEEIGIEPELHRLPEKVEEPELLELVNRLNSDKKVKGILVQLPLPEHIDERKVLENISPYKDVDGLTQHNLGRLLSGNEIFEPCTPKGIMRMLKHEKIDISGKDAVVIGRSNIVGKPVAIMLMKNNATVTICHSKTQNIEEKSSKADILVVAVGRPEFVKKGMVKEGAVVIDVGTNKVDGKLMGDVDFEGVKEKSLG
jgi:methylenetetrahydrofolate dehydrogenase (NADP+)/methenyltetrahydrofolate cyclohydrolase